MEAYDSKKFASFLAGMNMGHELGNLRYGKWSE
jgi:hypothetical protein